MSHMSSEGPWDFGLRIVDFFELSKQLYCRKCGSILDLTCTQSEDRIGLASILFISCRCGALNDVHTSTRVKTEEGAIVYSHNTQLSSSMTELEMDPLLVQKLFASLCIPTPSFFSVSSQANNLSTHQPFITAPLPAPISTGHNNEINISMSSSTSEVASHLGAFLTEHAVVQADAVASSEVENVPCCREAHSHVSPYNLSIFPVEKKTRASVKRIRHKKRCFQKKRDRDCCKAVSAVDDFGNRKSGTQKQLLPSVESGTCVNNADKSENDQEKSFSQRSRRKTLTKIKGRQTDEDIDRKVHNYQERKGSSTRLMQTFSVMNDAESAETASFNTAQVTATRTNKSTTSPHEHVLMEREPQSLAKEVYRKMCDICGVYLSSCSALSRHRRLKHRGGKPLTCPVLGCGKSFARSELLESHVGCKHSEEKPFQCFRCGRQFGARKYMSDHMARCGRSPYKCHLCELSFKDRAARRDHVAKRHEGQFFVCHCGKVYQWRTSLAKHQKNCPKS